MASGARIRIRHRNLRTRNLLRSRPTSGRRLTRRQPHPRLPRFAGHSSRHQPPFRIPFHQCVFRKGLAGPTLQHRARSSFCAHAMRFRPAPRDFREAVCRSCPGRRSLKAMSQSGRCGNAWRSRPKSWRRRRSRIGSDRSCLRSEGSHWSCWWLRRSRSVWHW